MMTINSRLYPAEVFWSDNDEGFIAVAADLPGCSAWGANEGEAITELRHAIEAWIEAAAAAGNLVPAPSKPASAEKYSGKLLLRLPKSLHADLDRQAKGEGTSLNSYVVYLLTKRNTQAATVSRMEIAHHLQQLASARTSAGPRLLEKSTFPIYQASLGVASTVESPVAPEVLKISERTAVCV